MSESIDELTATSGKWLVTTKHSVYTLDFDTLTATRIAGERASRWQDDDQTYPLAAVPAVQVGSPMILLLDDGQWITSTSVKSISPLWDDAA